jgi:preprotein translocase subunit YajC
MTTAFFGFLAQTPAPAPGPDSGAQSTNMLVWFGALMIIMWVLMIRPQQKKQKELAARIAAIKTGDRVVTAGGIHGVVTNVKDGATLILKVDDSCKLTVDKSAVVTVLSKDAPAAA